MHIHICIKTLTREKERETDRPFFLPHTHTHIQYHQMRLLIRIILTERKRKRKRPPPPSTTHPHTHAIPWNGLLIRMIYDNTHVKDPQSLRILFCGLCLVHRTGNLSEYSSLKMLDSMPDVCGLEISFQASQFVRVCVCVCVCYRNVHTLTRFRV